MSDEDISDDDVEVLLAKFFRNYQGVPVIPVALHQYDAWYEPEVSRVLAGYLAQSEEESEAVAEESEDEPSPPVKKCRVVRKMSTAKSASTPEKSRGAKAVDTVLGSDEAASEEVVITDLRIGDVSVDMVPETVPSTEVGVAPELSALAPSAAMMPVADQAVLGLLAGIAGVAKEVSPVLATGTLLSNVIASGLGEKIASAVVPTAPNTRPPVAEKKRVRLPPR